MLNYLNRSAPKQQIQLEVLRDDKRRNINATLAIAPDDTPAKAGTTVQPSKGPVIGVTIRNLMPNEMSRLDIKGGVVIQDVRPGGIAAQARIIPNDIVTHINGKAVLNSNQFVEEVSELKTGNVARVTLVRQGQRVIVGMRIS